MKQVTDNGELVQRFNADEAVWRRCERNRELRHLLDACSPLSAAVLDGLDWLEAERECRKTWCIGRPIP